ncbi:FadR/GntR family transcriptional regulator [Cupriavidus sp. AU9028]|uniref:FadR/GntR family transcriptional regulator n=1 Tax=Cupriavidus sp. AU9028 TaxID=2871157 RepID=UPI001C93E1AB|nr:FadR/GntR family transcriptional regulator [Cupriavidus sp. AU9028]MBY4898775.1 FadR family transcriptional regulator [Cupriavidus sp. AU9028]
MLHVFLPANSTDASLPMQPPSLSLPERVYATLSAQIRNGSLPPGTRLPIEPALCERYGVSRTVLREAIARLKAEGLLDVRQGRGTYVLPASAATSFRFAIDGAGQAEQIAQILELAELRLGVEITAAGLAAQRRSKPQLAQLKRCLDAMEDAVRNGTDGSGADLAFHAVVAQATGNSQYRMFMDFLGGRFATAIATSRLHSAHRGMTEEAQREHRAIYEAIAAGKPASAERAMRRHIEAAAARLADGQPARAKDQRGQSTAQ